MKLSEAIMAAPADGFEIDRPHNAGGVFVAPCWDARTSDAEIEERVHAAASPGDDIDAAIAYWRRVRDAARESIDHLTAAKASLLAGDIAAALLSYDAAAHCEEQFGDRPSYPHIDREPVVTSEEER